MDNKKKIAIIVSGAFLSKDSSILTVALRRYDYLKHVDDFDIDLFILEAKHKEIFSFSFFKGEHNTRTEIFENLNFTVLEKTEFTSHYNIVRDFLEWYHNKRKIGLANWEWHKKFARNFKNYNLISAHFDDAGIIAEAVYQRYHIPYCVTWHGSDIHTIPANDDSAKEKTVNTINNAACNFFVSNALLQISNELTNKGRKEVLYNAADSRYGCWSKKEKENAKLKHQVSGKKVVGFVGSLTNSKNAHLLPYIYKYIEEHTSADVYFWIIGSGSLKTDIELKIKQLGIQCKVLGQVPNSLLPEFYNCMSIMVLPSKREGLPLVAIEAMSCGALVVGSAASEVKEAVGDSFSVEVNENSIVPFAERVCDLLRKPEPQFINPLFSWQKTADKEIDIYKNILGYDSN